MIKKSVLRAYARLIAQVGGNVRKGQEVIVRAALDQPEFVRMVVEECYRCGASRVVVDWTDPGLTRLHYRHQSLKKLSTYPPYELERWKYRSEVLPVMIYLDSEDPDSLKGVSQEKMAKSGQRRYLQIKAFHDEMEGKYQWCIAAVPGKAWAKKVFPELRTSQAVDKLWEAILVASRVTEDPVSEWEKHSRLLQEHCEKLNEMHIRQLHYTSTAGTDLTVGLIEQGRFCGGSEISLSGIEFEPNIPTEECFISPMKGKAEGWVIATRPLCYNGQLIENFRIRFEDGKAVEWHAEKNESLLTQMIGMDEGSAYLGECALVPQSSPIAQSGILFYNTLFDENAACHLALGRGFPDTIDDYQHKTLEECRSLGVNESMIHEDFMIGSEDLDIDAVCADGSVVPIFRKGNWAF